MPNLPIVFTLFALIAILTSCSDTTQLDKENNADDPTNTPNFDNARQAEPTSQVKQKTSVVPDSNPLNIPFINDIPDYTQTHVSGEHTGNGSQYCAPVAVSNSLVWLIGNSDEQQKIILKLASDTYMDTSLKNGTSVSKFLKGVDKFVTEEFGSYQRLQYEGWRPYGAKYTTGRQQPNLSRLTSSIGKNSATWLNIGWYKYDGKTKEYTRVGGHWVTLVGHYDNQFIIHDPSPRAGNDFSNDFSNYSILTEGKLVGDYKGLPRPAQGFIQLNEGFHKSAKADAAIIDGAVYLNL